MIEQTRGNLGKRKIQVFGGFERIPQPELLDQIRSITDLMAKERKHTTSDELLIEEIDKHLTCDACHMLMPVLRDFKELFPNYNFSALNNNLLSEEAGHVVATKDDWQDVYQATFKLMGTDRYEDSGIELQIQGFSFKYENKHSGYELRFGEGLNYLLTDYLLSKLFFAPSKLKTDNQVIVEYLVDIIGEDALRIYANANPIQFFDLLVRKLGFEETLMLYRNVDMILFSKAKESPDHGIDLHREVYCSLAYTGVRKR